MARVRTEAGLQREARRMGFCGEIHPTEQWVVCGKEAGHDADECQSLGGCAWVPGWKQLRAAERAARSTTVSTTINR
jgi:hypothetical protein